MSFRRPRILTYLSELLSSSVARRRERVVKASRRREKERTRQTGMLFQVSG
jgi:predicted GIY-YIG superfamily endonuclease